MFAVGEFCWCFMVASVFAFVVVESGATFQKNFSTKPVQSEGSRAASRFGMPTLEMWRSK
jgi:hypothetical protein